MAIFKTKSQFTKQEIINAANLVTPEVEKMNGYLGRKLAVSKDDTRTDIVYWKDLASAEHAAEQVMKTESCKKFFEMIDEKSIQFMHLSPVIDE